MKKIRVIKAVLAGAVLATGLFVTTTQAEAAKNFTDLNQNDSHYPAIKHLNKLDAFDYKTGTQFKGNSAVTRAEVSKILHSLYWEDMKFVRTYNNNFKDVSKNNQHFKEMVWSYEVGIFDGNQNGKFSPTASLTRAQMSKILVNAFDLESKGKVSFKDLKSSHWAYDYVSILGSNGITTGDAKGNYSPNGIVTLSQFSTFMHRNMNGEAKFEALEWEIRNGQTTDDLSKPWTIKFSQNVKKSTINNSNVYVKNENDILTSHVTIGISPNEVIISAPNNGYKRGNSYTLYVENLRSIDDVLLTTPVKMSFTIDGEEDDAGVKEPEDPTNLTSNEKELARLINEYRRSLGLEPFLLSKSMMTVARTHVIDSNQYKPERNVDIHGVKCNLHSWSGNGKWSEVCYTSDHAKAENMWDKPKELTNYQGDGFEISVYSSGVVSPATALRLWKGSSGHNNVIIGNGSWSTLTVMGVGIDGNYSHVWFGKESDPEGYIEF